MTADSSKRPDQIQPHRSVRSAFAAAAAVFGAVHGAAVLLVLLKTALTARSRRKFATEPLVRALVDARFAAIVAAGSLSFRLLGLVRGVQTHTWTALRGAVAAAWFVLDHSDQRRSQLALFLLVRSVYYAVRAAMYVPESSHEHSQELHHHKHHASQHDIHRRHGRLVLRTSSSTTHTISSRITTWVDRHGLIPVWLINAFFICRYSLLEPDLFDPSYFNSLLTATSSRDRYGPHYKQVVGNIGKVFDVLSRRDPGDAVSVIPTTMDTVGFLNQYIREDDTVVVGSSSSIDTKMSVDTEAFKAITLVKDIRHAIPNGIRHEYLGCCLTHPGEKSCEEAAVRIMGFSIKTFVKAYTVINGGIMLLHLIQHMKRRHRHDHAHSSESRALNKHDTHIVTKDSVESDHVVWWYAPFRRFIRSTFMSTVSLSMFLTIFMYSICCCRRILGRERLVSFGISGVIASPSMLLENTSRISELNVYCSIKTIEAMWKLGVQRGLLRYIPRLEMVVVVPAASVLSTVLEKYPYAVYGMYAPILRSYFGTPTS